MILRAVFLKALEIFLQSAEMDRRLSDDALSCVPDLMARSF